MVAAGVLTADAFTLGGLSIVLPTMTVPTPDCVTALRDESGAVLVWPWDGADTFDPEAPSRSRMLQVAHGRPGATIGTGSWPLVGRAFPGDMLRSYAWVEGFSGGNGFIQLQALSNQGFRWIVADMTAPERLLGEPDALFGKPTSTCPDYRIYEMPAVTEPLNGVVH